MYVREDCIAGWEPMRVPGTDEEFALIHLTSGQTVKVKGYLDERLSEMLDDDCENWDYTVSLSPEAVREQDAREAAQRELARKKAERTAAAIAADPVAEAAAAKAVVAKMYETWVRPPGGVKAALAERRAQRAAVVPKE